jgi:hypothetical protein
LKDFGVKFNGKDFNHELLEYYDRNDIIKPIMRINRPLINDSNQRYYGMIMLDNYRIRDEYLEQGLAQFPEEIDFQDWSSYRDGSVKTAQLYYHPAQFMAFQDLTLQNAVVSPSDIENIENPTRFVEELRGRLANEIQRLRNAYRQTWTMRLGLLILLEEAYAPLVGKFTIRSSRNNGSLSEEWKRWREKVFSAQDILDNSGMSIEEVRAFYELLAWFLGFKHDPLELWFVFQQYIKDSKVAKLKQQALRAQEYYRWARMVNEFIYDLTSRPMPPPDELDNPIWKEQYYGVENFNYLQSEHRRKVLNDFLEEQLPQMTIAVEGDTEEYVVNAILRARNIKPDREGLNIFNAKGSNMERKIEGYLEAVKEQGIRVFVIVDNDKKDFVDKWVFDGIVKKRMTRVWKDDFESDNFGRRRVLKVVNTALTNASLQRITGGDVRTKIKEAKRKNQKTSFMRALDLANLKKNKCNIASIISKKEIAQSLIKERLTEIAREYESNKWETNMKIEKLIKRILTQLMPRRSY